MHQSISQHQKEIANICIRYGVRKLEVFGSAARGKDFDQDSSDADFLVEFHPHGELGPLEEFFGLREALAKIIGRHVDLVEPGAVRNPYVLAQINQARETVFDA
jgi:uncharacterized protein